MDDGWQYLGKISKTIAGLTCQAWGSNSPHRHDFLSDSMFPDGSVTEASNFCRNPDNKEHNGPWCYTTDVNVRWQHCDVPLCGRYKQKQKKTFGIKSFLRTRCIEHKEIFFL